MLMPADVLLVVNCQEDNNYGNRHLLRRMYGVGFRNIAFAIGATCPIDHEFTNIVSNWRPRQNGNRCPCLSRSLGQHPAGIHGFHARLLDVARAAAGFDFVVFIQDDCIISPRLGPREIRQRCSQVDAVMPSFVWCSRDEKIWPWAQQATGYPTFDSVAGLLSRERLLENWFRKTGDQVSWLPYTPMFIGFVDWLVFRSDFLQKMAHDLTILAEVWVEAAIPTAVLHNTSRIGSTNGIALWGADRHKSLEELTGLLKEHDFVHPIKLSTYADTDVIDAYLKLV